MLSIIVFSKNRPAQLELLLRTLNPYQFDVTVLYKHTEDLFAKGYELVKKYHKNVKFEEETVLKDQILPLIGKYTCFMTDDSFVYRTIDVNKLAVGLDSIGLGQFSLRLGVNTYENHGFNSVKVHSKKSFGAENGLIWWECTDYKPHEAYGYKMSVDGHIYSGKKLRSIVEKIEGGNPNQIECQLGEHHREIGNTIIAFRHSVLVINPVNRVQEICTNWNGEKYPADIYLLNDEFLKGKRIQIPQVEPDSTHYECPLYMV